MAERLLREDDLDRQKPSPTHDIYLSDGGGLYARVLKGYAPKDKRIAFTYRYKINGRTEYFPCGTYPATSLKDARKRRDAARAVRDRGASPLEADREKKRLEREQREAQATEKTLRGLFEDWERIYLEHHRKDKGAQVRQFLETDVLSYLGKQRARSITRRQIVQVIDRIIERGARRKANMVLSLLRQMFRHGLERGIVDADPTFGMSKKSAGGRETPRQRNLSAGEITELSGKLPHSDLPERAQAAVWILLATGARVGELLGAEWKHVNLKARTWSIPETKSGTAHVVHLSDFAAERFKQLSRDGKTRLLFEGKRSDTPVSDKWLTKMVRDRQRKKSLKGRSQKAGTLVLSRGEWTLHDLRRTMASRMQDLHVLPHVIEKCLNHKLQGILAVYQTADLLPERKAAFEAWGGYLERLVNPSANVVELRRG